VELFTECPPTHVTPPTATTHRPPNQRRHQIDIIQTLDAASSSDTQSHSAGHAASRASDGDSAAAVGGLTGHTAAAPAASGSGSATAGAISRGSSGANLDQEAPADCLYPCWWQLSKAPDPVTYVKRMSFEDAKQLWREFVRLTRRELHAAEREESGAAARGAGASGEEAGGGAQGLDDAFVNEEHQFLWRGSSRLPEGVQPGTAKARMFACVNHYLGALKHIHLLNACAWLAWCKRWTGAC